MDTPTYSKMTPCLKPAIHLPRPIILYGIQPLVFGAFFEFFASVEFSGGKLRPGACPLGQPLYPRTVTCGFSARRRKNGAEVRWDGLILNGENSTAFNDSYVYVTYLCWELFWGGDGKAECLPRKNVAFIFKHKLKKGRGKSLPLLTLFMSCERWSTCQKPTTLSS